MTNIEDVFKSEAFVYNKTNKSKRKHIPPEDFKRYLLESIAPSIKYGNKDFVIDDMNKSIISDLYYYFCYDEKFSGDLDKGIILGGAIGTGKTLLMTSLLRMYQSSGPGIKVRFTHAKDIQDVMNEDLSTSRSVFLNSIAYIDDIGKEPSEYKEYGNTLRPFEDFIRRRYERNILTFGTTNYTLKDLPYIQHTKDRMKEMFNFLVLPGKSRRK